MAGRLVRRVVPVLAPRLALEGRELRPGHAAVRRLEDPGHLDADEQPPVPRGEVRDLRHLLLALGLVGEALAGLLPGLAEIRAPPDRRAVPLARSGRVDRAARVVVDRVVHRPVLAVRAAQAPVLASFVALQDERPLAGPDQHNRLGHPFLLRRRDLVSANQTRGARGNSSVDDDRHRPVVDELDRHLRAEDAGRHLDAELAERRAERLVERLGLLGRRGVGEARAVALRRVGEERELRDDERGAAGVEERDVELAVALEDPQARDLAGERGGVGGGVAARDAEEDAQARGRSRRRA